MRAGYEYLLKSEDLPALEGAGVQMEKFGEVF